MAVPTKAAGLSDFSTFLLPEQAQDYFKVTQRESIVQRLARQVPMGPTGIAIPHWNGAVQASWVAEGDSKPLTKGSFTRQTLNPTKIAVIFAESAEVVRLNPLGYLETMQQKIGEAFALAFDAAALHGINKPAAFGGYLGQTTNTVALGGSSSVYSAVNTALGSLTSSTNADGRQRKWNGTLRDLQSEPLVNTSVDGLNRPLFLEQTYSDPSQIIREGRILGRTTLVNDHVKNGNTVGFIGDFDQVIWGQIGGLSFDVTDQATLDFSAANDGSNLISLWQHNMVAVRCEAEFAFLVNDTNAFVKLVSAPTANTVTITGAPTGGSFTLKLNSVYTNPIAYNATAAVVKAAIVTALPGVNAADITVTGSGPYAITSPVTVAKGVDSFTGGTSPASTVS